MFKKVKRIVRECYTALYNACFNQPLGYVYMFHRVAPADGAISEIDELRVSPEYFRDFLIEQSRKIEFVDIEQAVRIIEGDVITKKPFGVITFDDGYDDNFTYAYPILKELGIPFTIYISVELVNDQSPIWNYPLIIERIIREHDTLTLGNGLQLTCSTIDEKNNVFRHLKALLFSLPYATMKDDFIRMFDKYLNDDIFPSNTMTWNQIQALANDPLCTIGSHTMSHCRLAMSDSEILMYELQKSKQILSEKIGKSVEHLSYPYGWITDVSTQAAELAQRVGYKTAFHSFGGPIRKKDKNMYHLKRIMVNE